MSREPLFDRIARRFAPHLEALQTGRLNVEAFRLLVVAWVVAERANAERAGAFRARREFVIQHRKLLAENRRLQSASRTIFSLDDFTANLDRRLAEALQTIANLESGLNEAFTENVERRDAFQRLHRRVQAAESEAAAAPRRFEGAMRECARRLGTKMAQIWFYRARAVRLRASLVRLILAAEREGAGDGREEYPAACPWCRGTVDPAISGCEIVHRNDCDMVRTLGALGALPALRAGRA